MGYNALWGLGRDPKYLQTPSTTSITDSSLDITSGASPPSNSDTVTIPSGVRVTNIQVTAKPQNRTQDSTNAKLIVTLNENVIATYFCPAVVTAGVDPNWQVNEIIPYNYDVYDGAVLKVTLSADNGGTTGYIMEVDIRAVGYLF